MKLPSNQDLRWKTLFAKHILYSKKTPDKSIVVGSAVVCVSEPRGNIVTCGRVTQVTSDVPLFPKYQLQIYNVIGNFPFVHLF